MSSELVSQGLGEFAGQIVLRAGQDDWSALIVPQPAAAARIARELTEEIRGLTDLSVAEVSGKEGATALAEGVRGAAAEVVICSGLERYPEAEWRHVELLRSQLQAPRAKVFVLSRSALAKLERYAPGVTSFLGADVWQVDEQADVLNSAQREARLQALRGQFGKTDDEVCALAERGELPVDPVFAEWLILLDRGDLL